MKKNIRFWGLALILCLSAQAGDGQNPWDCIRDGLAGRYSVRPAITQAAQQLEAALNERTGVVGVAPDKTNSFLLVNVRTANELRHIESTYIRGYASYAVVAQLGLTHPQNPAPRYRSQDTRRAYLYRQGLLLEFSEAGARLKEMGQKVPYALKRRETPEQKIGVALRTQLALDRWVSPGGWNPNRRLLLATYPTRLFWDFIQKQYSDGVGIPHEGDLREAGPIVVADFLAEQEGTGLVVHDEETLATGSHYLLVTVPSFEVLLKVLAHENVGTADVAENFDRR